MSKLEDLRARKAEREAKRQEAAESREVQALELEEKYITDGKVPEVDFTVVQTEIGCFVVQKPDYVVGKRFADEDKKTTDDVAQFAARCTVFPDATAVQTHIQNHGGLAWRLAAAASRLFAVEGAAQAGKS